MSVVRALLTGPQESSGAAGGDPKTQHLGNTRPAGVGVGDCVNTLSHTECGPSSQQSERLGLQAAAHVFRNAGSCVPSPFFSLGSRISDTMDAHHVLRAGI